MAQIAQFAPMLASRTAAGVHTPGDFEIADECENCEFAGVMEFFEVDAETAVAECPVCNDPIERYTGPDAA
jgi:hypothetical protein